MVTGRASAALLALVSLALVGCTVDVADESYPGMPTEVEVDLLEQDGPIAILQDDGALLAVTTWGSSSCHRVAESVEWDADQVRIRFGQAGGPACTADLAPRTHEFEVPADQRGRPLRIEIAYTDWSGVDELTVG
ncbi:hypothetical protein [Agromyces bauzanensis]